MLYLSFPTLSHLSELRSLQNRSYDSGNFQLAESDGGKGGQGSYGLAGWREQGAWWWPTLLVRNLLLDSWGLPEGSGVPAGRV